jgi:hypothetical protein
MNFLCHYLFYFISLDIHQHNKEFLTASDQESFVEIESLKVFIHYGAQSSIEYIATKGKGYRLPKILYNEIDE